jgi:hypothetical protein
LLSVAIYKLEALDELAKSITREITERPLMIANGLFGRRVEPDLAGTIITNESLIQRKDTLFQHSWDVILNWEADVTFETCKEIFLIG